jgi:hypothetical protein
MSETTSGEYLGLPILEYEEFELLSAYREDFSDSVDRTAVHDTIVDYVLEKRPYTDIVINLETKLYLEEQVDEITDEYVIEYCEGLDYGFKFIIGCFTYVSFIRSSEKNIKDYFNNLPKDSAALPLRKRSQYNRVSECLSGIAELDPGAHGTVTKDLPEIARKESGDYLFECMRLENIIDIEIEDIVQSFNGDDSTHFVNGFVRGTECSIAMYIQSREQGILDWLSKN